MEKQYTIIAHFGVEVLVKDEDGHEQNLRIARNSGHVVGDHVHIINKKLVRLERHNFLARLAKKNGQQVIAANLDAVGIVVATKPKTPDTFLDHVLIAAKISNIKPFIIVGKADVPETAAYFDYIKKIYGDFCEIFLVSTKTSEGIAELYNFLEKSGTSILLGVSGVGKSSLTNMLVPDAAQLIGHISQKYQIGKHTTTMSSLHKLKNNGEIIDSPGVRDFAPVALMPEDIATNFAGFAKIINKPCKYRNCLHSKEPGCSVKLALADKLLKQERYDLYLRLLDECQNPLNI